MNGCRRNESWNEEIWSGGHLRSSRRTNFCDMDEERNVQFPFFLSFFLFFLDTCPIFNFFPTKFFDSWGFSEEDIFLLLEI